MCSLQNLEIMGFFVFVFCLFVFLLFFFFFFFFFFDSRLAISLGFGNETVLLAFDLYCFKYNVIALCAPFLAVGVLSRRYNCIDS